MKIVYTSIMPEALLPKCDPDCKFCAGIFPRKSCPVGRSKPEERFTFWNGAWHPSDSPYLPESMRVTRGSQSNPDYLDA